GHSVGGYGSVTTNKVIATIVGDLFGLQVQAYPMYGSEKKGVPATYFLTVGEEPDRAHAGFRDVGFVPLHKRHSFNLWGPVAGLVPGGAVFISASKPRSRIGLEFDSTWFAGVHSPKSNPCSRIGRREGSAGSVDSSAVGAEDAGNRATWSFFACGAVRFRTRV